MSDQSTDNIVSALIGTPSTSLRKDIFEHVSTVSHTLVIGLVAFILFLCFNEEFTFFTWHPLLYTLGVSLIYNVFKLFVSIQFSQRNIFLFWFQWMFLMLEAILVVSPDNIFSKRLSFKLRVQYHWIIQILAVGFSTAGFFIDFINKSRSDRPHFKSWHALIGLISMGCCIPTCLNGVAALFNTQLRKIIKPSINKLIHVICGIVTLVMGSVAMILGLYSWWFEYKANEASRKVCFVIIIFTTMWCCVRPLITVFNRIKSVVS